MRRADALGRDRDIICEPNMALPATRTTLFLLHGQNRKPRLVVVSGFKERWHLGSVDVSS
jgi:hypothetical protein